MEKYYAPAPGFSLLHHCLHTAGVEHTDNSEDEWHIGMPAPKQRYEQDMRKLLSTRTNRWVTRIPGSQWMSNKAGLWYALWSKHKHLAKNIMPESWLLVRAKDRAALRQAWRPGMMLILKNPRLQRRKGLRLTANPDDALRFYREGFYVTQRLITRQRLLGGRRFHVRLYLLAVRQNGKISFWTHRFKKLIYAPNRAREGGIDSWLTRSVGSHELPPGLPYTWDDLGEAHDVFNRPLLAAIEVSVKRVNRHWGYGDNHGLELLGVDILFTETGEARLLEMNRGPDMTPKCRRDYDMKLQVGEDTVSFLDIQSLKGRRPGGYELLFQET